MHSYSPRKYVYCETCLLRNLKIKQKSHKIPVRPLIYIHPVCRVLRVMLSGHESCWLAEVGTHEHPLLHSHVTVRERAGNSTHTAALKTVQQTRLTDSPQFFNRNDMRVNAASYSSIGTRHIL